MWILMKQLPFSLFLILSFSDRFHLSAGPQTPFEINAPIALQVHLHLKEQMV